MALRLISCAGGQTETSFEEQQGSGVIGIGDLVVIGSATGGGVAKGGIGAFASISSNSAYGVAVSANTSGTSLIKVIPFVSGQRWLVDATSTSAKNQVGIVMAFATAGVLTNTSTGVYNSTGIFICTGISGALSDKKLIGEVRSVFGGGDIS